MRILMVSHLPWTRELGAARVQVELAEALAAQGHTVGRYCLTDAFERPPRSTLRRLLFANFARRATKHVAAVGGDYDVIDAREGDLPGSKASMGFGGLLVSRSVGSAPLYERFLKDSHRLWPDQPRGSAAGRAARFVRMRREVRNCFRSFHHADVINVPNAREAEYLEDELGLGDRCVRLPFGLSAERLEAFVRARRPPRERLARQEVAFIGYWSPRKGSRDWPEIVRRVRAELPHTRFTFLGTGVAEEVVLRELGQGSDAVRVVPRYTGDELPELVGSATVGAFPSYIEGFPFGVLEKLAAALPTVAYDAPGAPEMLDRDLLVATGDTHALAERLISLLRLELDAYAELSAGSGRQGESFSWERVAAQTAGTYEEMLSRVRRASS